MRVLKADVSDEAFQGWTRWVDRHGVTVSSLLEAIGLELAENAAWNDPANISAGGNRIIERAREIQARRRRRS